MSKTSSATLERLRSLVGAWQPFTGSGLAAFATASEVRLFLFQFAFATLAAVTVAGGIRSAWFPVVEQAFDNLPVTPAGIRASELNWPSTNATLLAAAPHLALVVDPTATGALGQNADMQIELRAQSVRFRGILGQHTMTYPAHWVIPLEQTGAAAAWGAWHWAVLTLAGLAVGVSVFVSWWALALLYAPGTLLTAWLGGRELTWAGALRLVRASLLPASLVMNACLMAYAQYWISLPGLVAGFIAHFVAGWIWLGWSLWYLPRRTQAEKASNPFDTTTPAAERAAPTKTRNPFGS